MADASPNPELPIVDPSRQPGPAAAASPCRHLRNKGMYVYTDGADDHAQGESDTSLYWCLQTMKEFGPDDDLVDGHECRNPARSCYEPL